MCTFQCLSFNNSNRCFIAFLICVDIHSFFSIWIQRHGTAQSTCISSVTFLCTSTQPDRAGLWKEHKKKTKKTKRKEDIEPRSFCQSLKFKPRHFPRCWRTRCEQSGHWSTTCCHFLCEIQSIWAFNSLIEMEELRRRRRIQTLVPLVSIILCLVQGMKTQKQISAYCSDNTWKKESKLKSKAVLLTLAP